MQQGIQLLADTTDRTPTILVVEDEFLIRAMLSDYLQECGFKVLEASSADEAVGIIENVDVVIDLVRQTFVCQERWMASDWHNGSGQTDPICMSFSHPVMPRRLMRQRNFARTPSYSKSLTTLKLLLAKFGQR